MERRYKRRIILGISAIGAAAIALLLVRPSVPSGPLGVQIDWVVQRAHDRGDFDGTILVARNGEILYENSFGLADAETRAPNTAETKYLIGSLTKPITAILVLQQIEAGQLTPDQPLVSFFPRLVGTPAGDITIHELLTHTSGIEERISSFPQRRISAEDLRTAEVQPSPEFEYSNTGFVCLALVLEAITGETYETLVHRKIFAPAGMTSSGVVRTGMRIDGLATGYRREGATLVPAEFDFAIEATEGAGSLYSSAHDLYELDKALEDGRLLASETLELMNHQHVKGRFGYGWFLDEQGGEYYPWHGGELPGYSSAYARQVHRREVMVILGNLDQAEARRLRTQILRLLKRQPDASAISA